MKTILGGGTAAVCLMLGIWVFGSNAAEPEDAPPRRAANPTAIPCLDAPLHWSQPPKLTPGQHVLMSWFVRFETPGGNRIPARVFLVEMRAGRHHRVLCTGHEVIADETFQPDFEIPRSHVRAESECYFRVNFGIDALVRTAAH